MNENDIRLLTTWEMSAREEWLRCLRRLPIRERLRAAADAFRGIDASVEAPNVPNTQPTIKPSEAEEKVNV